MSLKRNIAAVSALSLIGALSLNAVSSLISNENTANAAAKFGDINSDGYIDAVDASILLRYYSYASTAEGTPVSLEKFLAGDTDMTEPTTSDTSDKDVSLNKGGDTFTILSWNNSDVPELIANWTGIYVEDVEKNLSSGSGNEITAPSGAKINFINVNSAGLYASEAYDEIFNSGDDVDAYFAEPYWALKYMDNDKRSAPLSALGITEKDMGEWYPYTKTLAKNSNGVFKSVPYDVAPGAFMYRSDLAEEYLGAKTPEAMQTAIGDWDKFSSSAKTIAEKSEGKVALADSIGGMWEAYSCGRFDFVTSDNRFNESDDIKYFADMAKELWNVGGVAKDDQWTDFWTQNGRDGFCMGYFVPSWAFYYNGSFVSEAAKGQEGKWSICEGPQAFYWGGNDILVNPSTDNGDDARSFILSAAFNSESMNHFACFNDMTNNMSVNAQLAKDNTYHADEMIDIFRGENYYTVFNQSARKIDIKKYTPYDESIKSIIVETIKRSYLDGNRNWDDTLNVALDRIAEAYTFLEWD